MTNTFLDDEGNIIKSMFCTVTYTEILVCFIATIGKRKNEIKKNMLTNCDVAILMIISNKTWIPIANQNWWNWRFSTPTMYALPFLLTVIYLYTKFHFNLGCTFQDMTRTCIHIKQGNHWKRRMLPKCLLFIKGRSCNQTPLVHQDMAKKTTFYEK